MQPWDMFVGVTPWGIRRYLAYLCPDLSPHYPHLVTPCVGGYTIPQVAVASGAYSAPQIQGSDISFFSSALGVYLSDGPLEDLDPKCDGFGGQLLAAADKEDPADYAARMLLAQWWATHVDQAVYVQQYCREVEARADVFVANVADQLRDLKGRLGGIRYEIRDAREVLLQALQDPQAVIAFAPPWYSRGYEKLWRAPRFSWAGPQVAELEPAEVDELENLFVSAPALTLVVRRLSRFELSPDVICAVDDERGKEFVACVTTNRPEEVRERTVVNGGIQFKRGRLRPWPGHMPPEDAQAYMTIIDQPDAEYYRALWSHLGISSSVRPGITLGAFIDGHLFGVVGTMLPRDAVAEDADLPERFAIVCPTEGVPLLSLLNAMTLSRDTVRLLKGRARMLAEPRGCRSTFFTPYPAVSRLRGLMTLVTRERVENGYKLVYRSDWQPWSWQEAYERWRRKVGSRS